MEQGITQADLAAVIQLITYLSCAFAFFLGFLAGSFR